jgi:hypothetical protein
MFAQTFIPEPVYFRHDRNKSSQKRGKLLSMLPFPGVLGVFAPSHRTHFGQLFIVDKAAPALFTASPVILENLPVRWS